MNRIRFSNPCLIVPRQRVCEHSGDFGNSKKTPRAWHRQTPTFVYQSDRQKTVERSQQSLGHVDIPCCQDSRSWHASAMHNPSGQERIAVVNRWCPWWLSVDDFAPHGIDNSVCRPLSHSEYLALPTCCKVAAMSRRASRIGWSSTKSRKNR